MNAFMNYCFCKLLSLRRDNDGFVVMFTLALFLLLFVFCASVYAVAETIHQRIRLQNACDAAAYSAAVVQADGLSRMATVNQALAWTYVQMTNHQMDYITYRWLRLTVKRYDEDKANAEGYHAYLVVNFNIDQGLYGLALSAADLAINRIVGYYVSSMQLRCKRSHREQGFGWWAGQGPRADAWDLLKLNGHPFAESINRKDIVDFLNSLNTGTAPSVGDDDKKPGDGDKEPGDDDKEPGDEDKDPGDEDKDPGDDDKKPGKGGGSALSVNEELAKILGNGDPDDPYGIFAESEYDPKKDNDKDDALQELEDWYNNAKIKVDKYVDEKYQPLIDAETDPDKKEGLEKKCSDEKKRLQDELEKIYEKTKNDDGSSEPSEPGKDISEEIKKIHLKYKEKIDQLDKNAPDYEAKKKELEEQCYQEIQALGYNPSGDSDITLPPESSLVGGTWEADMYNSIKGDKATIQLLNQCHASINQMMETTMKTVAEFVLAQMLRDPRVPDDQALKKYYSYIYIPKGFDPYSAGSGDTDDQEQINSETQAGAVSNIFAPLYNTEPYERIFLQYATAAYSDQPLYACFPVAGTQDSSSGVGWGLDQWFVRTGTEKNNGVRPRTEGALGLQRGYKDSNLNETNAGVLLLGKKIDRGNHIMNLFLGGSGLFRTEADDNSNEEGVTPPAADSFESENLLAKFLQETLQAFFSKFMEDLTEQLADITASCGNARSETDFIPMCSGVDENTSLYSEYEWSSAKWLCLGKAKLSLYLEYMLCRKFHKAICDYGKRRRHGRFDIKHKGLGHYHIPKWFCGKYPRFLADVGSHCSNPKTDMIVQFTLQDMFPPVSSIEDEGRHGYMESAGDVDNFVNPIKGAFKDGFSMPQDKYESCVPFIDGMLINKFDFTTGGFSGLINGHARIYGDDKEVWDADTYVGEVAKPWVLSENFFSGAGTIVVGVAMKHENPFVQMLTMLQQDGGMINGKSVLSAFDPPSYKGLKVNGDRISAGNCIWTMSAARAGVRRTRRNGAFDQERMYQVTYDPTSDPENMFYLAKNEPYLYKDGGWGKYKSGDTAHKAVCVLGGCICLPGGPNILRSHKKIRKMQLQFVWNLCETDWDATLLPLRYAGVGAQLSGLSNEATYQERREKIENMDLQNDPGDGKNWAWAPASMNTSAGNENPMNLGSGSTTGWAPLDPSNTDNVKLESLLPDGEKKLNLEMLLRQNRIL